MGLSWTRMGDEGSCSNKYVVWLILAAILSYQFFVHLHTRFVDWPETVFFSWIISKGFLPYRDFFENHNPGVYYISGLLFRFFGLDLKYVRWEVTMVMALNTILLFLLARRCFNSFTGIIAALFFVLLEFQFYGNGLWFEQFVLPFLLMAANVLSRAQPDNAKSGHITKRYLLAGFLLGLGAVVKQPVLWNVLGIASLLLGWATIRKTVSPSKLAFLIFVLGVGFAGPLLLNFLYLVLQGGWREYLYGAIYVPLLDWHLYRYPGLSYIFRFLFWGVISVVFLCASTVQKENHSSFSSWLLAGLFLTSVLFDFPTHGKLHLIPAVAFVSIFVAYLFVHLNWRSVWLYTVLLPFLVWTITGHVRFLKDAWGEKYKMTREISWKAALWVKENTQPNERIYAPGNLHFYFFSDRLPASYNPYLYAWLLRGQYGVDSIIKDLEQEKPRFVFLPKDQVLGGESSTKIADAIFRYIFLNYEATLVLDGDIQVFQRRRP